MSFENAIGTRNLVYQYDDVELDKTRHAAGAYVTVGQPVTFREDGDVMLVEQAGTVIGQMKPTRLVDMIRDWEAQNEPYRAELSSFPFRGGAAKISIGFYRDRMAALRQRPDAILARIGKPSDVLLRDMIGMPLGLYLDEETGRYTLTVNGLDAGLLPLPTVDQIHAISREPEDMAYLVDHVEHDDEIGRTDWYVLIV